MKIGAVDPMLPPKAISYTSSVNFFYHDERALDALHSTGFSEKYFSALLDRLILKHPTYGQLNPLLIHIDIGAKVCNCRCINKGKQKHIIENHPTPVSRSTFHIQQELGIVMRRWSQLIWMWLLNLSSRSISLICLCPTGFFLLCTTTC